MKKVGLFTAMHLCRQYPKMDTASREALRRRRFDALVAYARANSSYYAKLYAELPDTPVLSELPPVTKPELM